MASGRRPPDPRRGSWFAQQGGAGLRFGGVQGSAGLGLRGQGAPAAGRKPRESSAPPAPSSASSSGRFSRQGTTGSDVSDALDELLSHARVTLQQLDKLRAQQQAQAKAAKDGKNAKMPMGRAGYNKAAQDASQTRRRDPRSRPGFWKPSCNAHLWSGGTPGTEDSLSQLGSDDEDLESTDSECEEAWDFIRKGASGPRISPAAAAASAASAAFGRAGFQARGSSVPPPKPAASSNDEGPADSAFKSSAKPPSSGSGFSGYDKPPSSNREPPPAGEGQGAGRRGHAAGFRFGGHSTAAGEAAGPGALTKASGPEAEVTATLEAAQASGGQEAARQALKRLLLRWHPDKAPQREASQTEATRVLRFILQERERLGL
mmetsp:Transcript_75363/g.133035  ORF Transcript_75363/g.133035 Transcript_75363/m.133035 type:complete len:375 (+) Transcript_75363:72-1196(+)